MRPLSIRLTVGICVAALATSGCGGDGPTHVTDQPSDLGTFSLTVTGALNGSTHLSALPLLDSLNAQRDFVGMNSAQTAQGFYAITVVKATSDMGPPDGFDNVVVSVNPLIIQPGVYANNSCTANTGGPAACAGVNYSISGRMENLVVTNRGSLNNLQDNRDTVTIEQIDPAKIRLSVVGPFVWTHVSATDGAALRDTVFVRASFEAYQMHR